jgi:NADP-dependent 3-hydroxy acid dehydrogenase YdfG
LGNDRRQAEAIYKKTKFIKPKDIALIVKDLINLPKHLNVNSIEVMPVSQAWGPILTHRTK